MDRGASESAEQTARMTVVDAEGTRDSAGR